MTLAEVLAGLAQAQHFLTRHHQHQTAAAVQAAAERLATPTETEHRHPTGDPS